MGDKGGRLPTPAKLLAVNTLEPARRKPQSLADHHERQRSGFDRFQLQITTSDVAIIEANSQAVLRLPDARSDENYLAIHAALSFALQKYLGEINVPVPAFLVFDQISRPYYPQRGEDESIIGENEAMSQHSR